VDSKLNGVEMDELKFSFGLALILMISIVVGYNTEGAAGLLCFIGLTTLMVSIDRRESAREMKTALDVIQEHRKELTIRRAQLTMRKNYGLVDASKWEQERQMFVARVVAPAMGRRSVRLNHLNPIVRAIEAATSDFAKVVNSAPADPLEYEQFVSDSLAQCGWSARTTKGSGDQGVDVIAQRGDITVVIQCKRYSKAVGNAAVQEVIAGKVFEQADFAAVVSNADYTKSARQLAETSGVMLLHHDQLNELYNMCTSGWSERLPVGQTVETTRRPSN
jgi:restriction system protein